MTKKKYQIIGKVDETDKNCKIDVFSKNLTYKKAFDALESWVEYNNSILDHKFYKVDDDMWLSTLGVSLRIEEMK